MRPLVRVEAQRAGDRVEHLLGDADVAALLEPGVPGHADARERRDLFPAQPRRTATTARRQADLLGRDPLPPTAQEPGQLAPAKLGGADLRGGGRAAYVDGRRHGYQDASLSVLVPGGGGTWINTLLVPGWRSADSALMTATTLAPAAPIARPEVTPAAALTPIALATVLVGVLLP